LRLLQLDLKAFGPFTGRHLDLSGGREGLHLVYGPNEAGKSSALRALKALFYGFPARSVDGFLHPNPQLRVGARLRLADGSELAFLRRKGKRSTLLTPDDETPLDDGLLDRCLQGIDEALFSSLFGLDHSALVQGGEELLAQRGDVGQALFAAGLGTRNLRPVLANLDAEADDLFLPRGKRRINQAIAEHREAKRASGEHSLSGREWTVKRREVEAKRADAADLERELAARKAEYNRLQRVRRAHPRLAERRDLLRCRGELGDAILLPTDFGDRLRAEREALRAAAEAGARAAAELAELAVEGGDLTVPGAIISQDETVERLHQGIELYTKDIADRSRLLVQRGDLRAEAERLLDELRPGLTIEAAGKLRPALGRWLRIQQLGNERQALWNHSAQATAEVAAAAAHHAAIRGSLAALHAPRDPASLRRRLAAARRRGDLDHALAHSAAALMRAEEELHVDLGRLGLFCGTPEEAEALPIPPEETLHRFQGDFEKLARRCQTLEDQLGVCRTDLAEVERRLAEIRRGGAVPTEEELVAARARRDDLWEAVRGSWLARELGTADPVEYERTVAAADALADRLRREAERVQDQAQFLARRDELQCTVGELGAEMSRAEEEARRLDGDWRILWEPCGIDPLPPREMHPGWTRQHEKLRARAEAVRIERRQLEALRIEHAEHRAAVVDEISAVEAVDPSSDTKAQASLRSTEALEFLLATGEERLRALEAEAADRTRLEAEALEAKDRWATARAAADAGCAACERWQEDWGEAVRDLGLDREALPSEAAQVIDTLRRAFASLNDAEKLDGRIAGLDRDLERFRASVGTLAAHVAPDLVNRPAEQAAAQLHALAAEARRRADRREALDRRLAKLEREAREAETTRIAMEKEIARLVKEAGCADPSGLDEAERRSARLHELARDLERVERQLRQDGEGLTLDELESEAARIDADELPGRIEQLDREIAEREARSGDLREELGRAQEELSRMTGGEAATLEAERAQEILAGLREDVEQYVRLRLASAVLLREIDRYRAENQDPVLRRAAEHFAALTLANYIELRTDFDDRDEPVLAALRQDGRRVRVEEMSDGTRDQLYLALRLATLERYLTHAEPIPFIVDDILINFDDERSSATLKILAELSTKTQVILFTHHARIRDLAVGLQHRAGVIVQEIEGGNRDRG
jgi:uncharacterized protein YhaN